jgi:hypothetical protein
MFENIPDKIINTIKNIIEEKDQCKLQVNKSYQTYWLQNLPETEFRLSRLGDLQILISRVCFRNRRCGTMSAILQVLKEYCAEEKIKRIRIQSVETYEMMQFCIKHDMKPWRDNIWINNILMGDYDLEIEEMEKYYNSGSIS